MKIKLLLFIVFLLMVPACYSQLQYRDISFADALKMAKQSGKIIFLQYESSTCRECNEVADKGLSAKEVSEKIQSVFIPVKITKTSIDRVLVGKQYNMSNGFGSLFIDFNGNLLHSFHRSTTRWQEYTDQITIALNKAGEALKLNELEKTYKQFGGTAILEMVISKRESLNLPYHKELDEYVTTILKDSLSAVRTLKFIARLAPALGSKADLMMHTDITAFQKAWDQLTMLERSTTTGKIVFVSMNKAIADRDDVYANKVADFAVNNNRASGATAERIRSLQMLRYYKGIEDTTKYLKTAINYYSRFVMSTDMAQIKKQDSLAQRFALDRAPVTDTIINGVLRQQKKVVQGPSYASYIASDLSNAAATLIKMSNDPVIHSLAYDWCKRALEFYESPGDLEIFSSICRKLGKEEEAQKAEEKRTALRKKVGM